MRFTTPCTLTMLTLMALAPTVGTATVVVQWGMDDNMTGGGFGLNLAANPVDNAVLDLNDPAMPDPATNGGTYYPNNTNSRSPVFFYTSVQTLGSMDTRVINGTPPANSEMRLGMRDTDGSDGYAVQGAAIVMWTKDGFSYPSGPSHGFLNGGDTNSVTLTSITTPFTTNGGAANTDTTFYWVIRLGSDFYATGGEALDQGTNLPDPGSALWFDYDPLTDITDLSNAASAAALPNLDDLTAVGMLLTFDHTSASNIYMLPETTQFLVEGVVPEPSTYALIVGIVGLAYVMRRRMRS